MTRCGMPHPSPPCHAMPPHTSPHRPTLPQPSSNPTPPHPTYQTAHQGALAYKAAFDRGGFSPEMLLQAETDNTDHAQIGMRSFIADVLKDVPLEKRRAIVENCYRHLTVLEEQAAMGAAFPGDEIICYLRMFYEVWHAQPEYYREVWLQCGLPLNIWKALMRMPEPTSAKWQVSHLTAPRPALPRCSHIALTPHHTTLRCPWSAQSSSCSAWRWHQARRASRIPCLRYSRVRCFIGCVALVT